MKFTMIFLLVIYSIVITGCAGNTAVTHIPTKVNGKPVKLSVFLDGTANDEGSHTNVAKLHNLTSLQNNGNISSTYIKGVGTDSKIIGMAMGWGIGHDVREAYLYLAENYNHQRSDEIYIIGFSRGSYAARILSALINVAGIPDVRGIMKGERYSYIEKIYDAYKSEKSIADRRNDVSKVIGYTPKPVKIEFLGLWDTVEALGWPDYKEDVVLPNPRYADQLCNVKKAAHALSIDDDRARIFTPILLTRNHLTQQCETEVDINSVVEEVWFSGAHADVGGGYGDTHISGVSLNWMLKQLAPFNLVPVGSQVYEDYSDVTHDPESGFFGLIYHRLNRNLSAYTIGTEYNNGRLKIHQSVLDRLAIKSPKYYESHWFQSAKYKHCFKKNGNGLDYLNSENCFDIVGYN